MGLQEMLCRFLNNELIYFTGLFGNIHNPYTSVLVYSWTFHFRLAMAYLVKQIALPQEDVLFFLLLLFMESSLFEIIVDGCFTILSSVYSSCFGYPLVTDTLPYPTIQCLLTLMLLDMSSSHIFLFLNDLILWSARP